MTIATVTDREMCGALFSDRDTFVQWASAGHRPEQRSYRRADFADPIDQNTWHWIHPTGGTIKTLNYYYLATALRCCDVPPEDVDQMLQLPIKLSYEVVESVIISGSSPDVLRRVLEKNPPLPPDSIALALWARAYGKVPLLVEKAQVRDFDLYLAHQIGAPDDVVSCINNSLSPVESDQDALMALRYNPDRFILSVEQGHRPTRSRLPDGASYYYTFGFTPTLEDRFQTGLTYENINPAVIRLFIDQGVHVTEKAVARAIQSGVGPSVLQVLLNQEPTLCDHSLNIAMWARAFDVVPLLIEKGAMPTALTFELARAASAPEGVIEQLANGDDTFS